MMNLTDKVKEFIWQKYGKVKTFYFHYPVYDMHSSSESLNLFPGTSPLATSFDYLQTLPEDLLGCLRKQSGGRPVYVLVTKQVIGRLASWIISGYADKEVNEVLEKDLKKPARHFICDLVVIVTDYALKALMGCLISVSMAANVSLQKRDFNINCLIKPEDALNERLQYIHHRCV